MEHSLLSKHFGFWSRILKLGAIFLVALALCAALILWLRNEAMITLMAWPGNPFAHIQPMFLMLFFMASGSMLIHMRPVAAYLFPDTVHQNGNPVRMLWNTSWSDNQVLRFVPQIIIGVTRDEVVVITLKTGHTRHISFNDIIGQWEGQNPEQQEYFFCINGSENAPLRLPGKAGLRLNGILEDMGHMVPPIHDPETTHPGTSEHAAVPPLPVLPPAIFHGTGMTGLLPPALKIFMLTAAPLAVGIAIWREWTLIPALTVFLFGGLYVWTIRYSSRVSLIVGESTVVLPKNQWTQKETRIQTDSIKSVVALPMAHGIGLQIRHSKSKTPGFPISIVVSPETFAKMRKRLDAFNIPIHMVSKTGGQIFSTIVNSGFSAFVIIQTVVVLFFFYAAVLYFAPQRIGAYIEPPLHRCSGMLTLDNDLYVINPKYHTLHRYNSQGTPLEYWTIQNMRVQKPEDFTVCLTTDGHPAIKHNDGLYRLLPKGAVRWDAAGICASTPKPQTGLAFNGGRVQLTNQEREVIYSDGTRKRMFIRSGAFARFANGDTIGYIQICWLGVLSMFTLSALFNLLTKLILARSRKTPLQQPDTSPSLP